MAVNDCILIDFNEAIYSCKFMSFNVVLNTLEDLMVVIMDYMVVKDFMFVNVFMFVKDFMFVNVFMVIFLQRNKISNLGPFP